MKVIPKQIELIFNLTVDNLGTPVHAVEEREILEQFTRLFQKVIEEINAKSRTRVQIVGVKGKFTE